MSDTAFPPDESATDARDLRAHAEWVSRLARSLLWRDAGAADDASQEALLAAWSHPPHGSTMRPWLSRVLRNAILSRQRSDRRRSDRDEAVATVGTSEPADVVILRMESHRRVVDAVLALPDAYRRTIALRYYEGLTSPEIAARLGVSEGTVRSRLQRGLALLRRQLGGDDGRGLRVLALLPSGALPASLGMAKLSQMGWIMTAKTKAMIVAGLLILGAVYLGPGREGPPEVVTRVVAGSDSEDSEAIAVEAAKAAPPKSPSRVTVPAAVGPATERAIDGLACVTGQLVFVDGEPCAGVSVELHGWARNSSDSSGVKATSWSDRTGATDPDGRFEFWFDPPPQFQFAFSIEDLRFADWSERWSSIARSEVLDLGRITVQPGASVRGRVQDDGGQGVADGWRVSAHHMDERFLAEDRATGSPEYALARLVQGGWRIDVHHQDGRSGGPWQVRLSPGQSLELDLTLGPVARRTIYLSAVLGNQAVDLEPATVRFWGPEGSGAPEIDSEGRMHFEPAGDGPYVVTIEDPRFLPWRREGVQPGQMLHAILTSTSSVLLHVVGVPPERRDTISVSLRLRPPADLVGWNSRYEPRSVCAAGTPLPEPFVIEEVAAGCDYDVVVTAEKCSERWVPVLGIQALEARVVTVSLTRGAALAGIVTEGSGSAPASGMQVFLYGSDKEKDRRSFLMIPDGEVYSGYSSLRVPLASTRTDAAGRFAFDSLKGGDYTLRARESASLDMVVDVTVSEDERREDMVISIPVEHELRVRLIAPDGLSEDGVRLVARFEDPVTEYWFGSDPPERERPGVAVRWNEPLSLKPLPSGRVRLFLEYDEYPIPISTRHETSVAPKPQPLGEVLLDGPVTERTIELGDSLPGTVDITVLANGQPLAGANMVLERGRGAITDDRGVARVPLAPTGSYQILVRPEDRSWSITLPEPVDVLAGAQTAATHNVRLATRDVRFLDASGKATCQGRFQVRSGWEIGDQEQDVIPDEHGVATMTLPVGIQTFLVNGKEHPIEWGGNGPSSVELRVE